MGQIKPPVSKMKTQIRKAALWLRSITRKVKRNRAALWLLQETLKAVIKKAIDTAPDWLPVVLELVERNN